MKPSPAEWAIVEGLVDVTESVIPPALRGGSASLFARIIRLSLKQWREEAGLTQRDAAERLNRTVQHISNVETKRLPGQSDMEILLGLYGKLDRVPFLCELLRIARGRANWWTEFNGAVPPWLDVFLALESGASEITSFDSTVVPDLFQVPSYARAVLRCDPDLTDKEVEERVELCVGRQRIFDQDDPPHVRAVLDEAVLHRSRGDAQAMTAQLEHLLEMAERPRVDVQVLPFTANAMRAGTFKVMAFPPEMLTECGVVYVELMTGGLSVDDPRRIAEYQREMARLRAAALDPAASRELVERVLKDVA